MGSNNSKGAAFADKASAFAGKHSAFAVHTVGSTITFHQNIKPLFTQWDQVQMLHNVQVGKPFNLWSYAEVRDNADAILSYMTKPGPTTPDGLYTGMPKYIGPLSEQDINLFRAWMSGGYLEGTPPKTPEIPDYPQRDTFLFLSELLTGFDHLEAVLKQINAPTDPDLASIYLYRLKTEKPMHNIDDMLFTFDKVTKVSEKDFEEQFRVQVVEAYPELVKSIIQLWYGAYTQDAKGNNNLGTPEFNQYRYGLVWINAGAHPMGYATYADNTKSNPPGKTTTTGETDFYWKFKPDAPDPKTGLFTKNTGY